MASHSPPPSRGDSNIQRQFHGNRRQSKDTMSNVDSGLPNFFTETSKDVVKHIMSLSMLYTEYLSKADYMWTQHVQAMQCDTIVLLHEQISGLKQKFQAAVQMELAHHRVSIQTGGGLQRKGPASGGMFNQVEPGSVGAKGSPLSPTAAHERDAPTRGSIPPVDMGKLPHRTPSGNRVGAVSATKSAQKSHGGIHSPSTPNRTHTSPHGTPRTSIASIKERIRTVVAGLHVHKDDLQSCLIPLLRTSGTETIGDIKGPTSPFGQIADPVEAVILGGPGHVAAVLECSYHHVAQVDELTKALVAARQLLVSAHCEKRVLQAQLEDTRENTERLEKRLVMALAPPKGTSRSDGIVQTAVSGNVMSLDEFLRDKSRREVGLQCIAPARAVISGSSLHPLHPSLAKEAANIVAAAKRQEEDAAAAAEQQHRQAVAGTVTTQGVGKEAASQQEQQQRPEDGEGREGVKTVTIQTGAQQAAEEITIVTFCTDTGTQYELPEERYSAKSTNVTDQEIDGTLNCKDTQTDVEVTKLPLPIEKIDDVEIPAFVSEGEEDSIKRSPSPSSARGKARVPGRYSGSFQDRRKGAAASEPKVPSRQASPTRDRVPRAASGRALGSSGSPPGSVRGASSNTAQAVEGEEPTAPGSLTKKKSAGVSSRPAGSSSSSANQPAAKKAAPATIGSARSSNSQSPSRTGSVGTRSPLRRTPSKQRPQEIAATATTLQQKITSARSPPSSSRSAPAAQQHQQQEPLQQQQQQQQHAASPPTQPPQQQQLPPQEDLPVTHLSARNRRLMEDSTNWQQLVDTLDASTDLIYHLYMALVEREAACDVEALQVRFLQVIVQACFRLSVADHAAEVARARDSVSPGRRQPAYRDPTTTEPYAYFKKVSLPEAIAQVRQEFTDTVQKMANGNLALVQKMMGNEKKLQKMAKTVNGHRQATATAEARAQSLAYELCQYLGGQV